MSNLICENHSVRITLKKYYNLISEEINFLKNIDNDMTFLI